MQPKQVSASIANHRFVDLFPNMHITRMQMQQVGLPFLIHIMCEPGMVEWVTSTGGVKVHASAG